MCGACGKINKTLTLADRKWTCGCGATHNRDKLAANNIFREGVSSLGVGEVRALAPIPA
jgi:putative transposase